LKENEGRNSALYEDLKELGKRHLNCHIFCRLSDGAGRRKEMNLEGTAVWKTPVVSEDMTCGMYSFTVVGGDQYYAVVAAASDCGAVV